MAQASQPPRDGSGVAPLGLCVVCAGSGDPFGPEEPGRPREVPAGVLFGAVAVCFHCAKRPEVRAAIATAPGRPWKRPLAAIYYLDGFRTGIQSQREAGTPIPPELRDEHAALEAWLASGGDRLPELAQDEAIEASPGPAPAPARWWRDEAPEYVQTAQLCLRYYTKLREQGVLVTKHPTAATISLLWAEVERLPAHRVRERLVSDRLLTAQRRTKRPQRFTDARDDAYRRFLALGGAGVLLPDGAGKS